MIHFFLACLIKFLFLFFSESSIYALDGVLGTSDVDTQERAGAEVKHA
jgi:hypothetical protein